MKKQTAWLLGCVFATAGVGAQTDAERQRMEYERQQREYWRAQEEQRAQEFRLRQQQDEQRARQEQFDREKKRYDTGLPSAPSQAGAQAPSVSRGSAADNSLAATRAQMLRRAPLTPDRNPLLGRWAVPDSKPSTSGGLAGQIESMLGGATCSTLFGRDPVEFRPDAMVVGGTRASAIPVQYRAGQGHNLFVLPQRGVELILFEMQGRDRASVKVGNGCALTRIGVEAAAAAPLRVTPVPQPAPQPSGPGSRSEELCNITFLDKLGVATFSPVRQALERRYKETLHGTAPNSQLTRLDARGSACDDPRIRAVLYDFDANGTLQSITFVWVRPAGPAPSPIFSERVHALSLNHPSLPQPQTSGRLQGDTSLGRLIVEDMPERNLLLEAYKTKN